MLECGQTRSRLLPAALVSVSLGDPRANGVAAWLKLAGKIVGTTSSTDEVDHLSAKLRDHVRPEHAGETPANMVDVFLASAAPLARDSRCPPNRVNPRQHRRPGTGSVGIAAHDPGHLGRRRTHRLH